jgi:hypothetical protein
MVYRIAGGIFFVFFGLSLTGFVTLPLLGVIAVIAGVALLAGL